MFKGFPVKEQIDGLFAAEMTSLDHDGARSHLDDPAGGLLALFFGVGSDARQHFGLGKVGGHHFREGNQQPFEGMAGFLLQKGGPALGDHHRVDHQMMNAVFLYLGGDDLHDGDAGDHSGLGRIDADVRHHGVDLLGDGLRRQFVDSGHFLGVLGGDGRQGAHAKHAQLLKRFQIGLDSCASTAVGPCDGQRLGDVHGNPSFCAGCAPCFRSHLIGWFSTASREEKWARKGSGVHDRPQTPLINCKEPLSVREERYR